MAGVFLTIDVECSMGGAWSEGRLRPISPARAILGAYGGRRLGLPLIVRILAEHGLAATFFVEPFAAEQGHPGHMEGICQFLLDRGQDVQLHIHPNHYHYGLHLQGRPTARTDQMADLEPDAQRRLLEEGAARLQRWTGRRPVAFRAGNLGASEETLRQVRAAGMHIDSSYSFPYAGGQCRFAADRPYNGTRWYDDVLELALSGFVQPNVPGLHRAKPLDLAGIGEGECRDAVTRITAAGAQAVVILHSFSLFKVRTDRYDGGRPNRVVIGRWRRLCRWLAAHATQRPVQTLRELEAQVQAGRFEARAVPPLRMGRPLRALARKAVQGVNRLYWI